MVRNGRSKDVKLIQNGVSIQLQELKKIFYDELTQVAAALDEYCPGYSNALSAEMSINKLPSERIMSEMNSQSLSFQEYGLAQSKKIAETQRSNINHDFSQLKDNAEKSLKDLKNLQENVGMDINKYVELYNSQI
jgi:gamma-glutamylcysteine synthetase